ncbi:F-box/LRR-repeat protein 6 [Leuresthes tenuis]|uniref:F-box/LRR-repeat protein 6 n=1 Tax=Leuresthes tenuis TaxID=355514 RepID=UPI003B51040D
MEAPEAAASGQSERKEEEASSAQAEDGPKSKKASLKRTSTAKEKKTKKARVSRPAGPGYTVQQGEDMLFVISNVASQYDGSVWKKGRKKRKSATEKIKANQKKKKKTVPAKPKRRYKMYKLGGKDTAVSAPQQDFHPGFGQNLPEEVLISIFQMVVIQDGAVPFLCRVGQVCRAWNAAASSPVLWRKVTLGHCWIAPGKDQLPKTERKVMDTVNWLAQNRFSQLRDFSLCHWTKNVNVALEAVSQFCPQLASIKLSYCSGLKMRAFHSLGQHSRCLRSIDLQFSEFQVEGFLGYLEHFGSQIKQILFTHGLKNDRLLTAISKGYCPDLELLEVNTKLDSKGCELAVCIQALQRACPKLKTFRMLNVRPLHRSMRSGADAPLGFPLLEELCIATTSYSYMSDKDLLGVLFGSTKLRVLDLRGCSRITPAGLAALPCLELECLFWGQYFTSYMVSSLPKTGLPMVTEKWGHTLQQLDIANQLFTEEDLEVAVSFLAPGAAAATLRTLNLSGTRITPSALRSVIGQQTSLDYLNVSSCRYLPRGVKKIYRGQEEIHQLLDKLE